LVDLVPQVGVVTVRVVCEKLTYFRTDKISLEMPFHWLSEKVRFKIEMGVYEKYAKM